MITFLPELLTKQVNLSQMGRHPNITWKYLYERGIFLEGNRPFFQGVFNLRSQVSLKSCGKAGLSESMFNFEIYKDVRIQEKMVAVLNMNCINEKRARILSCKWLWLIPSNYSMHTSHFCKEEYQASSGWKKFRYLVNQQLINRHQTSSCEKLRLGALSFTLLQNTVTFLLPVKLLCCWKLYEGRISPKMSLNSSLRLRSAFRRHIMTVV